MKKSLSLVLSLAVVTGLFVAGCGKYEEGPGLSLRSKKGRLAGTWTVEKATSTTNGTSTDFTSFYNGFTFTMEKDGKYTIAFGSTSDNGTWEFDDKKERVITTDSSGDKDTMTVIRLTNKEFWTKDTYGNTTNEIHYKQ